jgi:hypothetical protein
MRNSSPCILFHGQKPTKRNRPKKSPKPNLPLLEFPIINQQLSVVLCLETSSDVNTLSSMSDILDFAVLFCIVVGMLLLLFVVVCCDGGGSVGMLVDGYKEDGKF